jgi:ribosome-associated heat shock protein Hsp15
MADSIRIDKWLWSVRLFKTRSIATDACSKGQVFIGDLPVKASRAIKAGEIIRVRRSPIYRSYKVLGIPPSRTGAKDVPAFMEEVTPQSELDLLEMQKDMQWISRDRGSGRPTKKERRDLEDFFGI